MIGHEDISVVFFYPVEPLVFNSEPKNDLSYSDRMFTQKKERFRPVIKGTYQKNGCEHEGAEYNKKIKNDRTHDVSL